MQREAQMAQARREAERNLQVNGQPMDLNREQMEAYASMPEDARQRLQHFMEKYKASAERNPKLYGNFIHSVFAKALLEQQMRLEDAATGCEAADPELGLLYRDISKFKDTEIPKAPNTTKGDRSSRRRARFTPFCSWFTSLVMRVIMVAEPRVSISR